MQLQIAQDELRDMQGWVEDATDDDRSEDEPGRKLVFFLQALRDGHKVEVTGVKTQ